MLTGKADLNSKANGDTSHLRQFDKADGYFIGPAGTRTDVGYGP